MFFRRFLGLDPRGIVSRRLGRSGSPANRPDELILHVDRYRMNPFRVVGAHGGQNYDQLVLLGRPYAKARFRRDNKGTNVQGSIVAVRNPVPVQADQLDDPFQHRLRIERRDAEPFAGLVHPLHVHVGTKQGDPAVFQRISFHAFKYFLAVMKHHGGRIQGDRSVRNDFRFPPPCLR
ncbi:hypothetical protein D1872_253020 [compost metagenome]